jgi:hypothetical protein
MRHLQTSQFPKHINNNIYITNLPGEGAREGGRELGVLLLGLGFQVSTQHKTQNTQLLPTHNKNAKPPRHGNIGNGKHS